MVVGVKKLQKQRSDCGRHVTGGHSRKRRRTTEVVDIEDRLESLITRVGEKVGQNNLYKNNSTNHCNDIMVQTIVSYIKLYFDIYVFCMDHRFPLHIAHLPI